MPTQRKGSITDSSQDRTNVYLSEYDILQREILKRIEIRYQIINLALIVAGTILTIGLQMKNSAVLLVYPVLSLFLAAGWAHNGFAMVYIDKYVREKIEKNIPQLQWKSYVHNNSPRSTQPLSPLGIVSTEGLFLSTDILTIALALLIFGSTTIELILLTCSLVATVVTFIILLYTTRIHR